MARTRSSLASLEEVAITRAPRSLANSRANSETPPVPCTRTTSPALTPPWTTTEFHAVTAAQGSWRPGADEISRSPHEALLSQEHASCITPSCGPPSVPGQYSSFSGPAIQR